MGLWARWRRRRLTSLFRRHAADVLAAARAADAAEAEAARQRVLELARRQRRDVDTEQVDRNWNGPTRIDGLPLLTYGQQWQYGTGRVEPW
ncbi:hypothetical protein [Plantactinospora sp. B24E8]|uniref:hypothetical protein n=1 Tax=Plantactinospora sp. B24E8 TaxID=3153567 RepID=UPI00325DDC4E